MDGNFEGAVGQCAGPFRVHAARYLDLCVWILQGSIAHEAPSPTAIGSFSLKTCK